MKLSFDEINDWDEFEDLMEDYFILIKNSNTNNLIDVYTQPSGAGSDGGRDILITFRVNDSIVSYDRKWVVQCKFHEKTISLDKISTVNIPSLIHSYNAVGYLLVSKSGVTSRVSDMFENLKKNCQFGYEYEIWKSNHLITKLGVLPQLIEKYFPNYQNYLEKKDVDIDI